MNLSLFSLAGRTALVTGASRGLGWAMARGLAEAGATVVLNGRDAKTLAAQAASLADAGLKADIAPFDVADERAARAGVDGVVARHGRIDILLGNAGIQHRQALGDWQLADWQRVIDTNLSACFVLAQQAARTMLAQRYGRIIMTTSVAATLGRPTIHGYVAAKSALWGLVRSLACELGQHGITCNAIAPGYFKTEMNQPLIDDVKFNDWVINRVPMRRWADPKELAGAAIFLASEAGGYVNGHQLMVDGGMVSSM